MTSNRAAVSWRPAPEEPHLKSPARKRRVGGRHQPISPEGPAKEAPSSPVDSPCLFGMENSAPDSSAEPWDSDRLSPTNRPCLFGAKNPLPLLRANLPRLALTFPGPR